MILHADELCPAVALGAELHAHELGSPHATGADVADFPGLNQVVQGFHCFFDGHVLVEAVNLEEIDVGSLEAGERGVDSVKDGLARKAWKR